MISRSWHANARILRWWWPLNHVRLLLWLLLLLRPLLLGLLLLLLLKQLSLLEELLPSLKFSLTHLLPLQLLLQLLRSGHTLASSTARRCWVYSPRRCRLLLLLLLLKLCLVELQLLRLLLLPEGCLLLRMQAALGTHWRLPGEPLRQLSLELVTACRHSSGSPLNCLLRLRQGCWDTTVGSLPLLLLLEVGPLQLLWSSGLLLRRGAGLLLLLLWLLLWRVRWADQRPLGCVRVLGRWFHDGLR